MALIEAAVRVSFDPSPSPLARFVRDLEAQAPRSLSGEADLALGDPHDHRAARDAWSARIADEHRSVAIFSDLLGLLARSGAPFDALCTVQRLIGDELRHVRLCARVAEWFGAPREAIVDADLTLPPALEGPEARAIEIVARELVVAEDESVRVLRVYRDATSDPACRAALSILLVDEARHAAAGRWLLPRLVSAFADRPIHGLLARLPAVLDADRVHIRALHAHGARSGPGRMYGAAIDADALDFGDAG